MANRYSDAGIVLKRSAADERTFVPMVPPEARSADPNVEQLDVYDVLKCAGPLGKAREAVVAELMDESAYEYRWQKKDDATWVLQERAK